MEKCPRCGSTQVSGRVSSFWASLNADGDPVPRLIDCVESDAEVTEDRQCIGCEHEYTEGDESLSNVAIRHRDYAGRDTERAGSMICDFKAVDCIEGMAALESGSVDVVVTSPPYNLGINYGKYRDDLEREAFLDWCVRWATELKRVLKDDGSFFLNVGASSKNPYLPYELVLRLRPLFTLQNTLHWVKSITVQPRGKPEVSAGHFKPLNSDRYVNDCHEFIFHLTKDGTTKLDRKAVGVAYMDKSNIARWGHTGGDDKRCRGNQWFIPYETIKSRATQRPHPATFPARLAEQCIRLHGVRDDLVVLDPFIGIGYSAIGAETAGAAKCIGFDIDEAYIAEAVHRFNPNTP